ncbi:MAG TPA: transcription antitermination factor NusB [Actinomycetota bacterium]|nr:transcription antitermination factor NusB [Actinomycetota bacterium]
MKARRAARRLALDVLYEAEIRDTLPSEALEARRSGGWVVATASDAEEPGEEPTEEALAYAADLVSGVQEHHADIDQLIAGHADRWAIERMPVVDRTLLRIALFELLWRDDIPVAVGINEAVELAKAYSTEDSGRFINGLLGRIVEVEKGA